MFIKKESELKKKSLLLFRDYKKAFTLIEIVVGLAIILILVSVSSAVYNGILTEVKIKKMRTDMENIKNEVIKYRIKYSAYPRTLNDLTGEFIVDVPRNPEGIEYELSNDSQFNLYVVSSSENPVFNFSLFIGPPALE
jgi:prepilin-type N-terminal cleavage/methylation domain-containing protein